MSDNNEQSSSVKIDDVLEQDENIFQKDASQHFEDPLLDSLVILTKLDHKPFSTDALKAGLPLVDGKLTPELFHRAAARAGFTSKIVKRKLLKIPTTVLPIILLLKENQACILENIDIEKQQAKIIQPIVGEAVEKTISLDELNEIYIGYSIFVKREFNFDNRTSDSLLETHNKHWFWGTLWQSKSIYRDVLLASFFINCFVLATPLYIRSIFDRVIPNNAMETLWVLSLGVGIIFIFEFILKNLRGYFIDIAGKKADVILSSIIFEKVMSIRMDARPRSIGAFADNIKSFETIKSFWTSATIAIFIDVPFFILFMLVIYWFAGAMVYIPLIAIIIIIIYSLIIRVSIKNLTEDNFKNSLQKNAILIEAMGNAETIKTLGYEGYIQRKWEDSVGYMSDKSLRIRQLSQSIGHFSGLVSQLSVIGVMIIGMTLVIQNELSSGSLILCMMLSRRAISPMSKVAGMIAGYQMTKASLDSLNKIMDLPVERPTSKTFINRPELKGKITFSDISFTYPGSEMQALKQLNFSIEAGEKVAFIGRIGSGKTTVEKLILGLYQPTDGQIRIDDVDLNQVDPADLRRNIGYISQDIDLFHGTVKENICIKAPYASDDEILRVAHVAGVTDFTNRHPLGFDMPVQERGEGLSGGQRQSISVARSLLHSPPVLLMDEPSNAMDNNTEAELKQKLTEEVKDRTLILITHRASLLSLVDRLIVLDNGEIIADGKKQQVLDALKQGHLKIRKNN